MAQSMGAAPQNMAATPQTPPAFIQYCCPDGSLEIVTTDYKGMENSKLSRPLREGTYLSQSTKSEYRLSFEP